MQCTILQYIEGRPISSRCIYCKPKIENKPDFFSFNFPYTVSTVQLEAPNHLRQHSVGVLNRYSLEYPTLFQMLG